MTISTRKRGRHENANADNSNGTLLGNLGKLKRGAANVLDVIEVDGRSIKEIIAMDYYKEFLRFADQLTTAQREKLVAELGRVKLYTKAFAEIQAMMVRNARNGTDRYREFMEALGRSDAMANLFTQLAMKSGYLRMQRGGTRKARRSRQLSRRRGSK